MQETGIKQELQQKQERKLATIRKIAELRPIPDADLIETAVVDGWTVVVKKGEYAVGNTVVFVEIDAWVPTELAPFLSKGKEPREYQGIKGERLRTVRLKKQLSQGLILPLSMSVLSEAKVDRSIGTDVTEVLGIVKWEIPQEFRSADAKGSFPSFILKTDQERVQNLVREVKQWAEDELAYEITEKLDGSSMTVFYKDGEVGVCSRNLELKLDEENTFWKTAIKLQLPKKLIDNTSSTIFSANLALQGELIGPGIQGNNYGLTEHDFYVFDIFDIDKQKYLEPAMRDYFCKTKGIKHVPVIGYCSLSVIGYDSLAGSVEYLLQSAEGKSALNTKAEREGLVFKRLDASHSFKVISNRWLEKHE